MHRATSHKSRESTTPPSRSSSMSLTIGYTPESARGGVPMGSAQTLLVLYNNHIIIREFFAFHIADSPIRDVVDRFKNNHDVRGFSCSIVGSGGGARSGALLSPVIGRQDSPLDSEIQGLDVNEKS